MGDLLLNLGLTLRAQFIFISKKFTSKFCISSRESQIIITQADTSNILFKRFLLDEASKEMFTLMTVTLAHIYSLTH